MSADFENGGTLSQRLPNYQSRPSQVEMARIVEDCILNQESAVVEAPTGTGKSLAYLIPIVRKAASMGKITVVSTSNKALQAQIFNKDIPFVQMNIQEFSAALMKGMNNFLCFDRLEEVKRELPVFNPGLNNLVAELLDNDGDFEKLPFQNEELRVKINGQTDECLGKECEHYSNCFYYKMKEEAKNASIIVCNHTILLMDIALGGRMLPDYEVLIIDEAHNLEKEAQEVFSARITKGRFLSLLRNRHITAIQEPDKLYVIEDESVDLFSNVEGLFKDAFKDKMALTEAFLSSVKQISSKLTDLVYELVETINSEIEKLELQNEDKRTITRYKKLADRTLKLARDIQSVCTIESADNAHFASRKKNRKGEDIFDITCTPLDVSDILKENLFEEKTTIVCTSATLTSSNTFNFFTNRVGMEPNISKSLPSVFNYEDNALFYFPSDIAQPIWNDEKSQARYEKDIAARMQQLVEYSGGRAFLLFTSNKMMNAVHRQLRVPYPILKQNDLPKQEMIRRFKERPSVLLGVASFWEGVDIAGDMLSLVVIDKLPFEPPDDPIQSGTVNLIKMSGGNEWEEYIIPRLIIKLKQGVGRLIRTDTDRGVVAILDQRLHTKRYGKQIKASLPTAPKTSNINDVARFFGVGIEEEEWDDVVGW